MWFVLEKRVANCYSFFNIFLKLNKFIYYLFSSAKFTILWGSFMSGMIQNSTTFELENFTVPVPNILSRIVTSTLTSKIALRRV